MPAESAPFAFNSGMGWVDVTREECDPSLPGYVDGCNDNCTAKEDWVCSTKTGLCVSKNGNVDENGNYITDKIPLDYYLQAPWESDFKSNYEKYASLEVRRKL